MNCVLRLQVRILGQTVLHIIKEIYWIYNYCTVYTELGRYAACIPRASRNQMFKFELVWSTTTSQLQLNCLLWCTWCVLVAAAVTLTGIIIFGIKSKEENMLVGYDLNGSFTLTLLSSMLYLAAGVDLAVDVVAG